MISRAPSFALGALLLGLSASPAFAQNRNPAVATELFNAGRDLMKSGDYGAACPKLAASARLDAKVGTLARLAECEEKVSQMVNARAHWEQAVNLARAEQDPRLDHAQSELARVDKLVPKVDVVWHGPVLPGLTLRIDGVDLGSASFGLALPVEAGTHALAVSADGKKTWNTTLDARASGAVLTMDVPALEDAPAQTGLVAVPPLATPGVPPPAVAGGSTSFSSLRWAGVTTAGVGVAGLIVGGTFGILAKVKLDDSNSGGCAANNQCNSAGFALRNDAMTFGNVSTALFIAGGVLVATGATLFVLGRRHEEAPAPVEATVSLGPGSVLVRGSF
jgi:hypothetical protein